MAFENTGGGKCFPPLPRWPAEVYPDEAAHGFFQRLTLENRQVSVRTLATNLGLNARNIVPETFLDLTLRLPSRNREELIGATPRLRGNMVEIRGQKLRFRRDWSTRRVRVCPGCIYEKPYHRFWFDLNMMNKCPIHSCSLVDGVGNDRLSWWYPEIGILPSSGNSVAAYHNRVGAEKSFEHYVLGRLGVLPPWNITFLDSVELYQIVDVAEILGLAKKMGWASKRPKWRSKMDSEWRQLVSDGFSILTGGKENVREFLQTYSNQRNVRAPSKGITYLYARYWGWLHDALRLIDKGELARSVTDEMSAIAAENGVYSKRTQSRMSANMHYTKFSDLVKILGVPRDFLREVTNKIGATEEFCHRGQTLYVPNGSIPEIKYLLLDLITVPQALKLLNVSRYRFPAYCEQNGVSVFLASKGNIATRFRKSDITDALAKNPPPAKYKRLQ